MTGGLAALLHHHRRQPLLRLLCALAVPHAEGEEEDQVWQKVRMSSETAGLVTPVSTAVVVVGVVGVVGVFVDLRKRSCMKEF